eukprot:4225712-Prymnesium_polylepis.1
MCAAAQHEHADSLAALRAAAAAYDSRVAALNEARRARERADRDEAHAREAHRLATDGAAAMAAEAEARAAASDDLRRRKEAEATHTMSCAARRPPRAPDARP